MKINTVVFDIGNVLLSFDPEYIFRQVFPGRNYRQHPLSSIVGGEIWLDLDRGLLEPESAAARVEQLFPGAGEDALRYFEGFHDHMPPMSHSVGLLEKLKERGFRLLFLSNFHDRAIGRIFEGHGFFRLFDGGLISSHVRMLKPDLEIYHELINRFNLVPEAALFIDDTLENITGARKAGLQALHLTDPADIVAQVETVLAG